MAGFFFFTDFNAVVTQTAEQAFGYSPSDNLSFRTNNLMPVAAGASAIAITDAIPFLQQVNGHDDLVNIVLYPVENPNFNFPEIKFYIYRGISKSSLINSEGNLHRLPTDWKDNNILKVLHDLQDKVNAQTGLTDELPTVESLGFHYSMPGNDEFQSDDKYLETTIFRKDDVQLPLIKAGCQIGQFTGGSTPAGLEIVLDRIGYEPKLELSRANDHVVTVAAPATTSRKDIFKHWHEKEEILTYVDPAAFYGCAKANDVSIDVYETRESKTSVKKDASEIVNLFHNKEVVYFDIRNDQNYSFDYFENFGREVIITFKQESIEEPVKAVIDFYEKWPLLSFKAPSIVPSSGNLGLIGLELPIKGIVDYNERYFLKSFTNEFYTVKRSSSDFSEINTADDFQSFRFKYGEPLLLNSWLTEGNSFGANYFCFKYSVKSDHRNSGVLFGNDLLEGTFPFNMEALIGDKNLEDGDFRIHTYSSMNAPIMVKNDLNGDETNEIYTQRIGVAFDKEHVTYFTYADQIGFAYVLSKEHALSLVRAGEYDNSVYLDEFDYDPATQALGFLTLLPKRVPNGRLRLIKATGAIQFTDQLNNEVIEIRDFLYYINDKHRDPKVNNIEPDRFDAVTISNNEWAKIQQLGNELKSENDFPIYLSLNQKSTDTSSYGYVLVNSLLSLETIRFSETPPFEIKTIYRNLTTEETPDEFIMSGIILKS